MNYMIIEERKTSLFAGKTHSYLELCRNNIWHSIRSSSGSIICSASGFIGDPQTDIIQIIVYPDIESWQTSQGAWSSIKNSLIKKEAVRILRPISFESKSSVPPEDRKNIYEYQKFIIDPVYLNEFTMCFEESIYTNFADLKISFLGIWTLASSTNPIEIIQMTGYESISHWEESKLQIVSLDEKQDELWDRQKVLRNRLNEITIENSITLVKSIDL